MSDLTPPPERRLADEVKAQMRAELIESTAEPVPPRRNGWLMPVAAAAAVAALIGGGAWLVSGGDGTSGAPTGGGTGTPTTSIESSTGEPTDEGTATPTADPGGTLQPDVPYRFCSSELRDYLPGADQVGSVPHEAGVSLLFKTNDQAILCDIWQVDGAPRATLTAATDASPAIGKDLFKLYMNFSSTKDAEYGAGGAVIVGVSGIDYTFPDGHTESATITGAMWSMVYLPTSGPLLSGRLPDEPVTVTVSRGGVQEHYTLEWGVDTCAQINHGC